MKFHSVFFILYILQLLINKIISLEVNYTKCYEGNQYWNSLSQACTDCPTNMQVLSPGYYCECSSGAAYESNVFNSTLKGCTACSGNNSPTPNQAYCKDCGGTRSSTTGACSCSSKSDALLYFGTDGDYLSTMTCQTCDSTAYPADNPYNVCLPLETGMTFDSSTGSLGCSDGYTLINNTCYTDVQTNILNTYPIVNAAKITYTDQTSTAKDKVEISNSALVNTYWPLNLIECNSFKNTTACQIISNLCVQTQHNENLPLCSYFDSKADSLAQEINGYDGSWRLNLPWVEYDTVVNTTTSVDTQYSFKETTTLSNDLDIYVATYNFTGDLLYFGALKNELSNCPLSEKSMENMKRFGNSYSLDCNFELSNYFETDKLDEMKFYELYLYQKDSGNYTDIPIVLKNAQSSSNVAVNQHEFDTANLYYERRFFLYDQVSGIEGAASVFTTTKPTYVQYLASATIIVNKVASSDKNIYRPYVYLVYDYASQSSVDDGTILTAKGSYKSTYISSNKDFFSNATIIFGVMHILVFIIWFTRFYIWTNYNPAIAHQESYCTKAIAYWFMIGIESWAFIGFIFQFFISMYWFVFFKLQTRLYVFMPEESIDASSYKNFTVVFWIVLAFTCFTWVCDTWKQTDVDIFFIDWEKQKMVNQEIHKKMLNDPDVNKGSVWRSLLVANEYNEMVCERYINVELLFLLYGMFMVGFDIERYSANTPYFTTDIGEVSLNKVLKYFLSNVFLVGSGLILYVLRKLLSFKIPTSLTNFVDLCSVANISIFIQDSPYHGYYIHGQNPFGSSEGTVEDLLNSFKKEEKGNSKGRGLVPNDKTELQTYEIFIPYKLRRFYDKNYQIANLDKVNEVKATGFGGNVPNYNRQNSQFNNNNREFGNQNSNYPNQSQNQDNNQPYNNNYNNQNANNNYDNQQQNNIMLIGPAIPQNADHETIENNRKFMQGYLQKAISAVVSQANSQVLEKSLWFRFLRIPPTDLSNFDGCPIFYRDEGMHVQTLMNFGKDLNLLLLNTVIFNAFDIGFNNTYLAILLTYLLEKFCNWVKAWAMKRNISLKTTINERFLN